MSAQETVPGQAASTCVLMLSMTSKPKVEPPALGPELFSPGVVAVSSSSSEASQPLTKQSWKKRRRMAAPVRVSFRTACDMTWRTAPCTVGQLAE